MPERSRRSIPPVTNARRNNWIKLPTDTPRHDLIQEVFGPTGVAVWVHFMQACKRSSIPGRVPDRDEDQLRSELRIVGWELLGCNGEPFTLRAFFKWTGLRKWTRRYRGTWPAIEYIGWEEEQSQRGRHPDRIPSESLSDPVNIPVGSREIPRSGARNTKRRLDKTRQDSTTTGGAVLSPESNDAPSARSPQGARSGRSSEQEQEHPDHEVGEPCRVLCSAHDNCARDCFACQQLKERTA